MASRSFTILCAVLVTFFLFVKFAFLPLTLENAAQLPDILVSHGDDWTFTYHRDANSHALSREQCNIAFPRLFDRIDAAVRERDGNPLRAEELELEQGRCMLRLLIYQGELRIIDLGDHLSCYVSNGRERIVATLNLIQRALVSAPELIPNIEFTLSYDDLPTRSTHKLTWGFTKREDEKSVWVMPDYGYWSWWAVGISSFTNMRQSIESVETLLSWREKVPTAVWRGTIHYAPAIRQTLFITATDTSWGDVKVVTLGKDEQHFLSLDDHCKHQFVLQAEGTSYSGRFKFLQLCNSVTVAHKLEFAEFATHLMEASGTEQNFVEAKRDWSDLPELMDYYLEHPQKAEAIAHRSYETFHRRYLTPAAVSCYLRRMFDGWAQIQVDEPQIYDQNMTSKTRKIRGLPFEAFAVSFPQDRPGEYGKFAA